MFKEKGLMVELDMDGQEIPAEYIFYGNEKAILWAKRTLDGVSGNKKKKF